MSLRIFAGFDRREAIGFHAFTQSVIERCSKPVSITALGGEQRDGTNDFTYSRFSVPYLCDFDGWAWWMDGADMLVVGDLSELQLKLDDRCAVHVVKHEYLTKHPRKYLGTSLEAENKDYPRKNWSSVILWNCSHYMNRQLTHNFIAEQPGAYLHRFGWLTDDRIGELPKELNWLADEYGPSEKAKILHWTAGIPGFYQYRNAPHADIWKQSIRNAQRGLE